LQVKNGTTGTVENIVRAFPGESHHITVRLDNAEGTTVTFDTKNYEKFTHAYASTVHRSQGITSQRAHVLASQFMDRHATYVAMTRHVQQVDMFYGKDEFSSFDKLSWSLSRDRRKDTTLDYLDRPERPQAAQEAKAEQPSGKPPASTPPPAPMRQTIGELKLTIGERPDQAAARSERTREERLGERVISRIKPEQPTPARTPLTREGRIAQRYADIQEKRKLEEILRRRDKDRGNDIALG
jgi:hypothetical protein